MEENRMCCSNCGAEIDDGDDFEILNGQVLCSACVERCTTTCDRCGEMIWSDDSYGDEYTTLCSSCYHRHYVRCCCCDALLHEDDAYNIEGDSYCRDCYDEEIDKNHSIHEYGYKPEPIFFGDSKRYFGVELEIDGAGKDSDNADELLAMSDMNDVFNSAAHAGAIALETMRRSGIEDGVTVTTVNNFIVDGSEDANCNPFGIIDIPYMG